MNRSELILFPAQTKATALPSPCSASVLVRHDGLKEKEKVGINEWQCEMAVDG